MNRRLKILTVAIICGVAVCLIYLLFPSEPRAHGHSLSTWLSVVIARLDPSDQTYPDLSSADATNAIRQIGSNAVPILLSKLWSTDPTWKLSFLEWLREKDVIDLRSKWYNRERGEALVGIQILGPEARNAIPDLKHWLSDSNSTQIAAIALASLGTEGIPALREALSHSNAAIRYAAVNAPYFRREIAPLMLNDILRMTNDPDPRITRTALMHIGAFAPIEQSFPILTNYLYDPRLRDSALSGLRRMGTNAQSATPHLLALYHQQTPNLKPFILPVLRRTDPAAAEQLQNTNFTSTQTRKN